MREIHLLIPAGESQSAIPFVSARVAGLKARMANLDIFASTQFFGIALHPWKIVGLIGTFIFGTRFILQWVASERAGRSVIPTSFWIVSACGSLCLLSYFAIYQRDSVGVLSNLFPLPIYLRNLYLQVKHKHPKHAGNEPNPEQ
jgi:lipid-A-disaccharide synthase-like uncharacterized protein